MPIAAWISALLIRLAAAKAGLFVASVLAFIGIEFATQNYVVEPILQTVRNLTGQLPSGAAEWVGFFQFDKYLSIIFSAHTVRSGRDFFLKKVGA